MFAVAYEIAGQHYSKVDTGKVWASREQAQAYVDRVCLAPGFTARVVELR